MSLEWEVKESGNFGKGVFATRTIEKWSKIVQLESEINVLEDFAIRDHCSKCLKKSSELIACPKCSIMKYCSPSCFDADVLYHKYECSWYHDVFSNLKPDTEHICIPSRSQRFLMRFVSHLEKISSSNPNSNLVDNCSEMNQELLELWKSEVEEIKSMVPLFAPNNSIGDLIRFCGILKSNSYMMRHKESGEIYGGQLIEIHSRINHSCDPNCVSSLDGTNVFLISLRKIAEGEEITVSYTDSSKPRHVRQEYLKTNLFFECKCSLCTSEEFEEPEALRTALKCNCGQILFKPSSTCHICNASIDLKDFENTLEQFDKMSSMEKFKAFSQTRNCLHDCHWINNRIADLIIKEFCTEPEYTKGVPALLVDFKTGLVRGSETISNPFILLARYEYALALINCHPELYIGGLLVASNYLKLAAHVKGVDDEIAQKFAIVSKKWSDLLNQLKQ